MAQSRRISPVGTMDIRQGWNPCSMTAKYLSPVGATEQSFMLLRTYGTLYTTPR